MSSDRSLHLRVGTDHRVLAEAQVQCDLHHGVVQARLHVEPGHLPPGTRTRLVDAILDLPGIPPGTRLQVSLPLGDSEILHRLRERCTSVRTTAAGASCLVEATMTARARPREEHPQPGEDGLPAHRRASAIDLSVRRPQVVVG